MGLEGYRSFKQHYIDVGENVEKDILEQVVSPNFYNGNTVQLWNFVPGAIQPEEDGVPADGTEIIVNTAFYVDWSGDTVQDRTVHEISMKNASGSADITVRFSARYVLEDDVEGFDVSSPLAKLYQEITIGPKGTAYFYGTALNHKGDIMMILRKGTQDDRNVS